MLVMRGMMGGCWAKRAKMLRQDRFEHVTPLNDLQLICIVQASVLNPLTMTLNTNLVERLPHEYGIKEYMQIADRDIKMGARQNRLVAESR